MTRNLPSTEEDDGGSQGQRDSQPQPASRRTSAQQAALRRIQWQWIVGLAVALALLLAAYLGYETVRRQSQERLASQTREQANAAQIKAEEERTRRLARQDAAEAALREAEQTRPVNEQVLRNRLKTVDLRRAEVKSVTDNLRAYQYTFRTAQATEANAQAQASNIIAAWILYGGVILASLVIAVSFLLHARVSKRPGFASRRLPHRPPDRANHDGPSQADGTTATVGLPLSDIGDYAQVASLAFVVVAMIFSVANVGDMLSVGAQIASAAALTVGVIRLATRHGRLSRTSLALRVGVGFVVLLLLGAAFQIGGRHTDTVAPSAVSTTSAPRSNTASPTSSVASPGNPSANASPPAGGPDREPPSVPSNLRLTGKTALTASLAWDSSTDSGGSGIEGYRVSRNGSYLKLVPSSRFTDSGLSPATTYSYSVAAVDKAGNQSDRSPAVSATTPTASADEPVLEKLPRDSLSIDPITKVNLEQDSGSLDLALSSGDGDFLETLGSAKVRLLPETGDVSYDRCDGSDWVDSIRSIKIDPYPDDERMKETQVCIQTADGNRGLLTFYEGRNLPTGDNSFHFNVAVWRKS
jgi:hypothetical protein